MSVDTNTVEQVEIGPTDGLCPNCRVGRADVFYEVPRVPVHSVLLVPTREAALSFPQCRIELAFCRHCGFIYNRAFEEDLLNYSSDYEETQGFSPTFNAFHKRLALDLIERYDLHDRDLIEIGCGKGEFLDLLCDLGPNRGIGFDPAYVRGRNPGRGSATFIADFYSERYTHYQSDFVCCKMTLEHIPDPARFIGMVRRSIGHRTDTTVFFQVPEVRRILKDFAFWDVYYEHCSYFSPGSLAYVFREQGFDVLNLWTDYDNQYLMIEARPRLGAPSERLPQEESLDALQQDVRHYADLIQQKLAEWRSLLKTFYQDGKKAVLWGGGSKAVAFLTTLEIREEIRFAVDINPHKHGTFLTGTGQKIVGPQFLKSYRPDVVIIMNPIYRTEISRELAAMELEPLLLDIEHI